MVSKRFGFASKTGIVVGLLTALLLFGLYSLNKPLAVHPFWQQTVWLLYLSGMFIAVRRQLSGLESAEPHWLEMARPAFVVFLIANLFFYGIYWLGHHFDPQLELLQKEYYRSMMTGSISEEDQAAAHLQLEESDLGSMKTVLFNYARAAIGGFIVSAIVGFLTLRLSPSKNNL